MDGLQGELHGHVQRPRPVALFRERVKYAAGCSGWPSGRGIPQNRFVAASCHPWSLEIDKTWIPLYSFFMSKITLHPIQSLPSILFAAFFWPCSLNDSVSRTFQSVWDIPILTRPFVLVDFIRHPRGMGGGPSTGKICWQVQGEETDMNLTTLILGSLLACLVSVLRAAPPSSRTMNVRGAPVPCIC